MSKYSEMGDASIAQKVWACLGAKGQPPCDGPHGVSNGKMLYVKHGVWVAFDPCNSWADAGPIIFNYGISIMKDIGLHLWCATSSAYWADGSEWQMGEEVMDTNPLRAAMIVFLMMQEVPNEC